MILADESMNGKEQIVPAMKTIDNGRCAMLLLAKKKFKVLFVLKRTKMTIRYVFNLWSQNIIIKSNKTLKVV